MNARALVVAGMVGLLLLGSAVVVHAQNPLSRRLEQLTPPMQPQTNAFQVIEPTEAQQSGDLGKEVILQPVPRVRMFEVYSDTQVLYDSNPLLVRNQEKADGLVYQTFQLSFTPRLMDKLVTSVYFRYQLIRYFEESDFDFDAQTGGIQLGYPVFDWLTAYGGWSAQQLVVAHGDETFYDEFDTQFGLRASFPLGKRANYFLGYQFDWRPSSPAQFNRVNHFGFVGVNVRIVDKLTAQFLYRLRLEDYLEETKVLVDPIPVPPQTARKPRSDIENLVSLALVYPFNETINLRIYALYSNNDSSRDIFNYDVVNIGGGLNVSFRF